MGRARFCKTTFTKKQICTNSRKGQLYLKTKDLMKRTSPCNIESLSNARSSYDLFEHVQFQEAKGLPSQHASQLPLGTPSEHFSASSRCHTSQKSGSVGPKGPNAMPCVSPVVSVLRPRIAGTLARAPHPANGVRTEQLGLSSPISSPWVERDFARPHLQNNKSAQTHRKFIRSENQKSQKRTSPAASISFHNAKAHTIYSKHVQFQEAKGLPSNMPASYHWEPPASTLAHRLAVIHPKNQDALAPRVQCHALCVSRCVGFETTHCRHPSTSPTPGQRCAD